MKRLFLLLALAPAGCGNLTEENAHDDCAEQTRQWWPVATGARWVYRVTDVDPSDEEDPVPTWKEQSIASRDVQFGGLAGEQRGIQMRTIDEGDHEWDYSFFVERDESYKWLQKRYWRVLPSSFPPDEAHPDREQLYDPARNRLDYHADRLCEGVEWHEQWDERTVQLGEADTTSCPWSTWQADPWACEAQVEGGGTTWTVVAADATVALFGYRMFYEHALCLSRLEDDQSKRLYCWVRDVGKVLECEWDDRDQSVIKAEELCLYCPPNQNEPCDWEAEDGGSPPELCTDGFWEGATCEDAILF